MKRTTLLQSLLLLCFLLGGVSSALAGNIQFVPTSTSAGTLTGAPDGVTATYSSTYSTKFQLTKGSSMTLTLTGFNGQYKITGITVEVKNNAKSGSGSVVAKIGNSTIGTLTVSGLGSSYQEKALEITPTVADSNLEITVSATDNSVYCDKFIIYYEEVVQESASPLTSIELSGDYPTVFREGDAFSHEGLSVTAHYEDESTKDVTTLATFTGYDMNTVGNQTVTVTYTEGEVTQTATYDITVNAIPTHTVTWSVNGTTTSDTYKEGTPIEFPANPADIEDKTFVGWTAAPIDGTTDDEPAWVTSATMGQDDLTFYAVFATIVAGGLQEVTDELTATLINMSSYGNWTGKQDTSDAVYAGNSTKSNTGAIQIRSTNNSGIVSTTSAGKVRKIVVEWDSSTVSGRTLDIYGKNTAYSSAADLYSSSSKQGTKLGSIVYGTSTELAITGDYDYVGLRSNNGAMYLTSIKITWESGASDTRSGYCTSLTVDERKDHGLSFAEAVVAKTLKDHYAGQPLLNPNELSPITWTSSQEDVATVEDGTVTVKAVGETTITATFDGDAQYKAGSVSYVLQIASGREDAQLTLAQSTVSMNAGLTKEMATLVSTQSDAELTYTTTDAAVAEVVDGVLVANGPGSAVLTISVGETDDYDAASVALPVTVTVHADAAPFDPTGAAAYKLVTDASTLAENQQLLIVNTSNQVAMSTTQNSNNRSYTGITIKDGEIESPVAQAVQVVTLEGTTDAWYLNVGEGYLYAASSSSNYLKTQADKTDNAKAKIDINNGTATVVFQGSNTRNKLQYNSSNHIFSCYASTSTNMDPIALYRLESAGMPVGEAGWRTLVTTSNVKFPDNVAAFIVTSSADKAVLTRVQAVKAGVPVLVKAEPGSYSLSTAEDGECDNTEANLLQVSVQNTSEGYVLANKSNGVGFYAWTGGWMGAGRVYLPVTSASRAYVGFSFGGETTGVQSVNDAMHTDGQAVYNLQGQRVVSPKKGILYVVNGKKVIFN